MFKRHGRRDVSDCSVLVESLDNQGIVNILEEVGPPTVGVHIGIGFPQLHG